jgi:hypothetical protein
VRFDEFGRQMAHPLRQKDVLEAVGLDDLQGLQVAVAGVFNVVRERLLM